MKRILALGSAIATLVALTLGLIAVQAAPETAVDDNYGAALQTVDQMVQDGEMTSAQAEQIKEKLASDQGFRQRFFVRLLLRRIQRAEVRALSDVLGMSPQELRDALKSGKSLRELAEEKGVSKEDIRSAMLDAAKSVLDQAVNRGLITEEQADRILERIESRGFFFFRHRAGPGDGDNDGDED